jgi:hypothetical protein
VQFKLTELVLIILPSNIMKQIRLPEYEFDIHFLFNSIKDYQHSEIQISTSCISTWRTAAISRPFSYLTYFQAQKLRTHSLIETKKLSNSFTKFLPLYHVHNCIKSQLKSITIKPLIVDTSLQWTLLYSGHFLKSQLSCFAGNETPYGGHRHIVLL